MSINIEAFRKDKDYICVHNELYTMKEYIERVDILEAQVEELKAKNEGIKNGKIRRADKHFERMERSFLKKQGIKLIS